MEREGDEAPEDEHGAAPADDEAHRAFVKFAAVPGVALLIGLFFVLRGGGVPGLDDARDRWEDNGPASYSMTYETGGMAGQLAGTVVVIDGQVDTFVPAPTSEVPPPVVTVEQLFDAIDDADDVEQAEFDDELGHPTRFQIDPDANATDDEWGFEIVSFDAID